MKIRQPLLFAILFALGVFVLFFCTVMLTKTVPYFWEANDYNFLSTKSSSTTNNLLFRCAFFIHISSSWIVIVSGLLLFLFLKRKGKVHTWLGRIYVIGILLLAAPSGFILGHFANGGLSCKIGFSLQSLIWWAITLMAFLQIRRGNVNEHIRWMVLSYALTLAAMSLRTESFLMIYCFHTKPFETYLSVTWLSWVGNLFLAEVLINFGLVRYLSKQYYQNYE